MNKKKLKADLDKVGQMIDTAKKANKQLTAEQVKEATNILRRTNASMIFLKRMNAKSSKTATEKTAALDKSVKESLIKEADATTEKVSLRKESSVLKIMAKRIQLSLDSVRKLSTMVRELSGKTSGKVPGVPDGTGPLGAGPEKGRGLGPCKQTGELPEGQTTGADASEKQAASDSLEAEDKGVASDAQVQAPEKAPGSADAVNTPAVETSGDQAAGNVPDPQNSQPDYGVTPPAETSGDQAAGNVPDPQNSQTDYGVTPPVTDSAAQAAGEAAGEAASASPAPDVAASKAAKEVPGGFEASVKHFENKADFKPKTAGDTKKAAAEKLCAYIKREKYGSLAALRSAINGFCKGANIEYPEKAPVPRCLYSSVIRKAGKTTKGTGTKPVAKVSDKKVQAKDVMASAKNRAKILYARAIKLIEEASKEKAAKKTDLEKRASTLEAMADAILKNAAKKVKASKADQKAMPKAAPKAVPKKATKEKTAVAKTDAATAVFASGDAVLLADGSIGKVSTIDGDKLQVSIGGVDKEVLAQTVKKITEGCNVAEKPKKKLSIKEKVKEAISLIRSGGKTVAKTKTADIDVIPAVAPDAPESTIEEVTESGGNSVSTSEAKSLQFVDGLGWTVNESETEVVSFGEDKGAAEGYVQAKKAAMQQDKVIDSADHAVPEGSEGVQKKLKGLDQTGKDYGTTTKEEKVNPQTSMIGKATKKTATGQNPGEPTDSTTSRVPDGSQDGQKVLKGLDQKGKGYSTTQPNQRVNEQFSMLASKNKILSESNKRMADRLSSLESTTLAGRAVKVGAITEEQRTGQIAILADLYSNSRAEFNAYSRLIANLESQDDMVGNRTVAKVRSAMANKKAIVVEASDASPIDSSLENGTFFED